ncbi:hypothetical protein [Paenibacillus polymyxa]|uniref:hypothetical protein n=1 Tax=Paenibacillus polymyxa TaxID=1406 RepID=UPI0007EB4830|nr:hypothetical protein [Paenibacillus polymyxa]OAZ49749.1 hypothetical protein A9Z39_10605 [Paenibacillus polymyxa]
MTATIQYCIIILENTLNGVINLPQSLTADFLLKTRLIEKKFMKELSIYKIMIDYKSISLLIASFLIVTLAAYIPFYALFSKVDSWWPIYSSISLLVVGFSLLVLSNWFAHSLARKRYRKYATFITRKKIRFDYDYDFIFAYRCDEILDQLNDPRFTNIEAEELIEHFSKKSTHIRNKRWWPITIASIIVFPLWSEFIGNNIQGGWQMLLFLLGLAILLTLIIIMFHAILKAILLSKASKYDELVNVLNTVKKLL